MEQQKQNEQGDAYGPGQTPVAVAPSLRDQGANVPIAEQVAERVRFGHVDCSRSLGIRAMPHGYALMWDGECFYYWLRHDGKNGWPSWDKWYCWRSAKLNSEASYRMNNTPAQGIVTAAESGSHSDATEPVESPVAKGDVPNKD